MSDLVKDLVGTWNVAFKQYRWTYTFTSGGTVTWRDRWGSDTGTGTWSNQGSKIAIKWKGSQTSEDWDLPINPADQGGNINADYASGRFSASKDLTRFDSVAPEGQLDAFACWAASLAWYTRASPDVPTTPQSTILGMSDRANLAPDGSISLNGIMTLSLPSVYLRRSSIFAGQLDAAIRARPFPMLVAFASGPRDGHVNVIHRFDEKAGTVMAMEPWYPDPVANPSYTFDGVTYSHKTTGAPFKFSGRHVTRPLAYYTLKPLNGRFVIGHNEKFAVRY
jgi:hypothetical protein